MWLANVTEIDGSRIDRISIKNLGIFKNQMDAIKSLVTYLVEKFYSVDDYNDLLQDQKQEYEETGKKTHYYISNFEPLVDDYQLVDGICNFLSKKPDKALSKLIEITDDSYYGINWRVSLDEFDVTY